VTNGTEWWQIITSVSGLTVEPYTDKSTVHEWEKRDREEKRHVFLTIGMEWWWMIGSVSWLMTYSTVEPLCWTFYSLYLFTVKCSHALQSFSGITEESNCAGNDVPVVILFSHYSQD
jgi:hypothetical protein